MTSMLKLRKGYKIKNITQTLELFEAAGKKYWDEQYWDFLVFIDTSGHLMSDPQYSNGFKYTRYAHTYQKFGLSK